MRRKAAICSAMILCDDYLAEIKAIIEFMP